MSITQNKHNFIGNKTDYTKCLNYTINVIVS